MIYFQNVFFMLLIIPLPILIFARYFKDNLGGKLLFSFSSSKKDIFYSGQIFYKIGYAISEISFWIGIICLVFALSDITLSTSKKYYYNDGIEIMIVLDESPSMSTKDFIPTNRLEASKKMLENFIDLRENDAIGLITFSTNAVLRTPSTTDYETLKTRLKEVVIADTGIGTSIGTGIALACLHLQKSDAKNKIIILITDGDDNDLSIPPTAAAMTAAELGIEIYTIGISTEQNAEFEYISGDTGKLITGFIKPSFNENLLKDISKKSGGIFFTSTSAKSLANNLKKIDTAESVRKDVQIKLEKKSLKQEFMVAGLLLLLFNFFINKIVFKEII